MISAKRNNLNLQNFDKLLKSYLGFLEGTGKSLSTKSSYKSDLLLLRDFFLEKNYRWENLSQKDFAHYVAYLEKLGLKTNTRRRKILSARSLLRYAATRKKLRFSPAQFVEAPARLERLPAIPPEREIQRLRDNLQKPQDLIAWRNLLLLEVLLETGMSVAELCSLSWADLKGKKLQVRGRKERSLTLQANLAAKLAKWQKLSKSKFLFPGYNRYGLTSPKITPRGVELLLKELAKKEKLPSIPPKTLRHFVILQWLKKGVPETVIVERLGVRKNYPFDLYKKWLQT